MSLGHVNDQHGFQSSSSDEVVLTADLGRRVFCDVPGEYDVICGRNKAAFDWKGNKEFRKMIWTTLPEYKMANSRFKRSQVVKTVVETIYGSGRRFLKKDKATNVWHEIGFEKAQEKTAHALRDAITADRRRIHPKGHRVTSQGKKGKIRGSRAAKAADEHRSNNASQVVTDLPECCLQRPRPQESKASSHLCRRCCFQTNAAPEFSQTTVNTRECTSWCDSINFVEVHDHHFWYDEDFHPSQEQVVSPEDVGTAPLVDM